MRCVWHTESTGENRTAYRILAGNSEGVLEDQGVGGSIILWHLLTTVARQTPRDMFSVWSDPSLLRNNGKAAFSTGSVPRQQWEGRVFFVFRSRAT
jgi:hypothetical protein